jgi:hypothetical protein
MLSRQVALRAAHIVPAPHGAAGTASGTYTRRAVQVVSYQPCMPTSGDG